MSRTDGAPALQGFVVFGHRGAAGRAPENTLAGFDAGIADGATWIECDLQAHPEALLVFHDDELARTTDGRGRLLDTPLALLRRLDAGGGERIPLLEEVLAHCRGRCGLNVELKAGPDLGRRAALALTAAVAAGWPPRQLLVSSFDHEALRAFAAAAPGIAVAPLFAVHDAGAVAVAQAMQAVAVHLGLRALRDDTIAEAHAAGLRVHVYTVNDAARAAALRRRGVDGVFTDFPAALTLSPHRHPQALQ